MQTLFWAKPLKEIKLTRVCLEYGQFLALRVGIESDPPSPVAIRVTQPYTEVNNLENEDPQHQPSCLTAQVGDGRELKFCIDANIMITNKNAKTIFDIPPLSQAMRTYEITRAGGPQKWPVSKTIFLVIFSFHYHS